MFYMMNIYCVLPPFFNKLFSIVFVFYCVLLVEDLIFVCALICLYTVCAVFKIFEVLHVNKYL